VVTLSQSGDSVTYEVQAAYEEKLAGKGSIDDGNHYVAVGLSEDSNMGEDSVIASVNEDSVSLYYNYVTGADREKRYSLRVGDDTPITEVFMVVSGDGALYSSFSTPTSFSYVAPTPEGPVNVDVDLAGGKFILASAGQLGPDGDLSKHSVRAFSEAAVIP